MDNEEERIFTAQITRVNTTISNINTYKSYNNIIQSDRKVAHIKLNVVITCIADIIIVSPTARW
jgi:hypothetical protein